MRKLIAAASTAAVLFVTAAPAAMTPATRTEFAGFVHFCGSGPPEDFRATPGGTVHIRGATNFNEWATTNALIDGTEMNVVSININPKSGNVHLDATLYPYAFDGTWEISQVLKIAQDGSAVGHGVGHGTGELHGMTMKFTTGPAVIVDDACSDLGSVEIKGVIISPAIQG